MSARGGIFHAYIAVAAQPDGPFRELDALVDTGSLYTWVPRSLLQQLGVRPTATRRFVLANGEVIDRDVAWIVIRLNGETSPTICVFGDEGTEPLLGVVALEEYALAADPVNQRLIPMEKLPAL